MQARTWSSSLGASVSVVEELRFLGPVDTGVFRGGVGVYDAYACYGESEMFASVERIRFLSGVFE